MTSFLFLCKPENLGESIDCFASNQFERVSRDDELWAVTTMDGHLSLEGHLKVAQRVDRAEAERLSSSMKRDRASSEPFFARSARRRSGCSGRRTCGMRSSTRLAHARRI